MSAVFLFGILWKKATAKAANIILTAGTVFSLGTGIFYLWVFPSEKYTFWPHFLLLSFFIFVILAVAMFIISLTGNHKNNNVNNLTFETKINPAPAKVWIPWILLIITMIGLYILFNGH